MSMAFGHKSFVKRGFQFETQGHAPMLPTLVTHNFGLCVCVCGNRGGECMIACVYVCVCVSLFTHGARGSFREGQP